MNNKQKKKKPEQVKGRHKPSDLGQRDRTARNKLNAARRIARRKMMYPQIKTRGT